MALINYATREINAKIVFYGPGLSGKTTNIHHVFSKVRPDNKGKLISLATQGDRTLFFDFLPVELGSIKGFRTRFHLYTVPGQVFYNSTRKMVLKGSDGVVFVADSQDKMLEENMQSLDNLKTNLKDMGLDFENFPVVIQYNKRDLPNAVPLKELNMFLNSGGLPYFEASAVKGDGVLKTLTAIVKYVLYNLKQTPDMQSLDFEAIQDAADSVVSGQVPAYQDERTDAGEAADVRDEHAVRVEAESAEPPAPVQASGEPDEEGQPELPDYSFEAPPLEDAEVEEGESGDDVPMLEMMEVSAQSEWGGQGEVEMPEASPDMFSSSAEPWESEEGGACAAAKLLDGLDDTVIDGIPSWQSEEDAELEPLEASLPEAMLYDTFPATSANTLDEVLDGYPPAGPVETQVPEAEPGAEIPGEFLPDIQADLTANLYDGPVEDNAGDEAGEVKPAVSARVADASPAAETAVRRIMKKFRLPVRFSTAEGVKEVSLSFNLDLELSGEGLDDVKTVEVLEPKQVDDRAADVSGQSSDKSKHPPPTPPAASKRKTVSVTEPVIKIRKKGMLEKMFGR